jgi:general secretion pathway protein F
MTTPLQTPSSTQSPAAAPLAGQSRLKVQSPDGRIQILEVADSTEAEAVRRAVSHGFRILAIESATSSFSAASSVLRTKTQFPLLLFSQELLALLEAGLNLTEALATLHTKERQPAARAVLEDVLRLLREGRSFSDVLALSPQHFPQIYVATVRAAERTGDLPAALGRFIAYQLQFEAVRKKLVSAAIYPVMLLVVGGLVMLFLLGYVVPRFSVIYESSGRELPWLSAALLGFGKLIAAHGQLALLGLVCTLALLIGGLSQRQGRAWLLSHMLRLPWLSVKVQEFQFARFYRAVSLLLAAGISLPRAMGMVTGLLSSRQQSLLAQCRLSVEQGLSFSAALVGAGLASPVAESLIKVGERTGQMAEMLERTARFADEDFSRWVDWASRLLEPVLMIVIGLVIGAVVVLMYIPIFELAGSLQ